MKRKPIKIDWDELDEAFSDRHGGRFYLDRVTGHVVLEHEEELDVPDDDDDSGEAPSRVPAPTPLRDVPTRLYIHPVDTNLKLGWMKAFLAQDLGIDPGLVDELSEAATLQDFAPRLKAILHRNPEARDIWYEYRAERRHEMIDAWLTENGVETITPPPWR